MNTKKIKYKVFVNHHNGEFCCESIKVLDARKMKKLKRKNTMYIVKSSLCRDVDGYFLNGNIIDKAYDERATGTVKEIYFVLPEDKEKIMKTLSWDSNIIDSSSNITKLLETRDCIVLEFRTKAEMIKYKLLE